MKATPEHIKEREVFAFDQFRLDATRRVITDESGESLAIMPKAFEILLYLVRRADEVVEKDELLSSVWPDTIVEENNLTQNISTLRRLLGEKHRENRFIATVPGRGYKFVAAVRVELVGEEHEVLITAMDPGEEKEILHSEPQSHRTVLIVLAVLVLMTAAAGLYLMNVDAETSAGEVRSIAVLPFKPLTEIGRDEAFELGMTESLIMNLSGEKSLIVRPLTAVRRYGALEQDAVAAGRALGVDAVLDGNIQAAGGRVKVSAMLIRVADGQQLWASQFHEDLTDVFNIQDSISQRVAVALKVTLGKRGRRHTESIEAFQLYSRGNLHLSRLIRPEVEKAIGLYEQAIAADPIYALAYVGLEQANRALVLSSDAPPGEFMAKAKAAAKRATELDPMLADSWTSLGSGTFWYDWDWQKAEEHFLRALDLDPNSARTRLFYGHLLSNIGRHAEALEQLRMARELDPANALFGSVEGQALFFAGREDDSVRALSAVIDLDSNIWLAHLFLSRTYWHKGMVEEAILSATRARELSRGSAEATAVLGFLKAKSGRRDEAIALQNELMLRSREQYVPSYTLAHIPSALGDKAAALDHLERAAEGRDALMVFLKVETFWNDLRDEERFVRILERMNLNSR